MLIRLVCSRYNMNKRTLPDSMEATPADVKALQVAEPTMADGICISAEPMSPPRRVVPKGSPADAFQQLLPTIQPVEVFPPASVQLHHSVIP
jgi:hypothetical protein